MAGRKLKVFQAQFGFFDSVVAASSRAAALRAWGVHQDLFANGEARVATDEAAVAAALQHPETPLRRAVGSNEPFRLEPTSLPKAPDPPKRPSAEAVAKPKPAAAIKPAADRTALEAAEAALRKLDDKRKQEEAGLRRRQDRLDTEKTAARSAYVEDRKAATAAIVEARRVYRESGGQD